MEEINTNEEYECPNCGEYLKLHKGGTMTNKKTGEFIYVYICEECNQAFALDNDDKIKLIPYDSDMKKIENKCKVCEKIENYNEKGLFLLNVNTAYYEFHCFKCAIPILQNWIDKNGQKKIKVTEKNANEIYEVYDFNKNNEMLQEMREHPEKYKETMDKVKKELDNLQQDGGSFFSSQP
jgi:DNA-directed RNA polymerase subunit RPC12/RpoP